MFCGMNGWTTTDLWTFYRSRENSTVVIWKNKVLEKVLNGVAAVKSTSNFFNFLISMCILGFAIIYKYLSILSIFIVDKTLHDYAIIVTYRTLYIEIAL